MSTAATVAAINGTSTSVVAVISVTRTIAVTGARTVAPKKAAIPTRAIGIANCVASPGHTASKAPTNSSPHSAPTASSGANSPPGTAAEYDSGTGDEPQCKDSDDDGKNDVVSAEDALSQVIAAAHRLRVHEHR